LALPLLTTPHIIVMLDLSPSTRGASYRDSAALNQRIAQLLPRTPYRIETFGENADQTIFAPPPADDILLFSDARFALPVFSPPTYTVIDPNLENIFDAAVTAVQIHGKRVTAAVRNTGPPREFHLQNLTAIIPTGTQLFTANFDPPPTEVTAYFTPSDAWPENDSLSSPLPPPERLQRWWLGASPPPGWVQLSALPTNPMAYLSASIIALNNIPAEEIPNQDPLLQYVRDLGGSLLILGGDHAFAAGAYASTNLDALSPLASFPQHAENYWIILVDASGSMAARWPTVLSAIQDILPRLPERDIVLIGSFSRDLHWWSHSMNPAKIAKIPPPDISPRGPTNLQSALESIATGRLEMGHTEIILISDADAAIDNPADLAVKLSLRNAHLNLLATSDASHSPVADVVKGTGGQIISQPDPQLWTRAARQLLAASMPKHLEDSPIGLTFVGELAALPQRSVDQWNDTDMKWQATELAKTDGPRDIPLAAHWRVGAGQVAAAAFAPTPPEVEALTTMIDAPPRDPRFAVSYTAGSQLDISIDAVDAGKYLNDLNVTLDVLDQSRQRRISLLQTAPGRYEISLPAPRSPMAQIVRVNDQIIQRFAAPARYAAEFDAIGNDHAAMQSLADHSGGAVIPATQTTPIEFHRPTRRVPLISSLAALGAALIAAGLLQRRDS
jgi:hypothetical protein